MDYLQLQDLQKLTIERKTIEELQEKLNKLIKEQTPTDYPSSTLQDNDKVQSNHHQRSAESVLMEIQKLQDELQTQKESLIEFEIKSIRQIKKEITDPLQRSFLVKRYILNKPVKEIIRDFGMSKSYFYKIFGKYFLPVDKKN